MNYAIILAGGVGSRMNAPIPKQFLVIGNKPILIHTIEEFKKNSNIDYIIVVCIESWVDEARKLVNTYFKNSDIKVISGGNNRTDSVLKGLNYINSNYGINDDDIVLTHDSVRPFITQDIINNNINECIKHGSVTTAVKAVDTILVCDNNKIVNVPVRDTMFHAQTPQTFKAKDLYELIKKEDDLSSFTDLCGLYLKHNKDVYIVNGVQNNFKITTREDLDCANNILI